MPDADIIPIGTKGAPGRGSARGSTPSSASRGLAAKPASSRAAGRPAASAAAVAPAQDIPTPLPEPVVEEVREQAPAMGTTGLPAPAAELLGAVGDLLSAGLGESTDAHLADVMAFLRRRLTGDYDVDEFGLDRELTEQVLLPILRPLYQKWFRVEVRGIENIPVTGGALVVANHSGTIAVDASMTALAIHDEHPERRMLRMLGADFVFSMPLLGEMARKTGSTLACNEDAHRLLTAGELVGVWPEGIKGIGKPFSERYRLQRFGRGGFVTSAVQAGVPIIPTAIVGAEEIYPIIGDIPLLARLLGAPYFPVTPTFPWLGPLGLVPLPSKWLIEFGEPLATDGLADGVAEDPMAVFDLGDQVRESIQQSLYGLLRRRRSVFF